MVALRTPDTGGRPQRPPTERCGCESTCTHVFAARCSECGALRRRYLLGVAQALQATRMSQIANQLLCIRSNALSCLRRSAIPGGCYRH